MRKEVAVDFLHTDAMARKVRAIARQMYALCPHDDMDLGDLESYGWEGVYHAASRYDPAHFSGASFPSYASWWIRYYMQRGIRWWGKANLGSKICRGLSFVDSDSLTSGGGSKAGGKWGDRLTDSQRNLSVDIWGLLVCLPEREAKVMILKHYYGYTCKEIASVMKISRQRVDQLEKIAIGKLRDFHEKKQSDIQRS